MTILLYIILQSLFITTLSQFSKIFNQNINIRSLDENNVTENSTNIIIDTNNVTYESESTDIIPLYYPSYIEIIVLGTNEQKKIDNIFHFLIYIGFNAGYIYLNDLNIKFDFKYKYDTNIYKGENNCTLQESMNDISKYNCDLNINGAQTLESIKINNDIRIGGIKPNKTYLSTSAKYSMDNLVKNFDNLGLEKIIKNGYTYGRNAHITKINSNEFIIEMEYDNYFYDLMTIGTFPTIDNKMVETTCYLTKNINIQMDCIVFSNFIAHFNNTVLYSQFENINNIIIIFNENVNDLIEVNFTTNRTKSNSIIVTSSSSSSSKAITYIIGFSAVGLVLIIIIIIVCVKLCKRRQRLDENEISQNSSGTTEQQAMPPFNYKYNNYN